MEKHFQLMIEDKTRLSVELANLKNQYEVAQETIKESFEKEEELKEALNKVENLEQ